MWQKNRRRWKIPQAPGWDVYDEACVESRQLCTLARQAGGFEAGALRMAQVLSSILVAPFLRATCNGVQNFDLQLGTPGLKS